MEGKRRQTMSFEIAFTLGVIVLALVLMAREWMAPDLLLLAALGLVTAVGVVPLEDALHGFSDPTLLAIGALFVVARGLKSTGVLRKAAHLLFGRSGQLRTVLTRLTGASAVSSAFLNNTPIVAMGIPAVLSWAKDHNVAPSKLLIPLSYASILGGICTLLGTSTNLVADGLLRDSGRPGLAFFELAWVGVPMALAGMAYLILLAPRLLPDRVEVRSEAAEGTLAEDIHIMRVGRESLARGRTVEAAEANTPELQLVRIVRESGEVAQVTPETMLLEGDRLTFRGDPASMAELQGRLTLEPQPVKDLPSLQGPAELQEVVVSEGSELVGEEVSHAAIRERFGAVPLGVVRDAHQLDDMDDVVLRGGDMLLLVAGPEFNTTAEDSTHLHLLGGRGMEAEELADVPIWQPTKAKLGLGILAGIVGLATTGVLHISLAALGGAILMTALGFVSPAEARRSIDWSVLLVIGAAIGLGTALGESGAADLLAHWVVALGEPLGPRGVLAAVILGAMLFTLTITNNAAVAILFPVAVAAATSQGLDPRPFVIAVTVGASLAFATPLGYQTNLMVYGPGGYSFGDFVRAGMPLQILLGTLAVGVIPIFWPM